MRTNLHTKYILIHIHLTLRPIRPTCTNSTNACIKLTSTTITLQPTHLLFDARTKRAPHNLNALHTTQ
jgi:hypothetical protein